MSRTILVSLLGVLALGPLPGAAQRQPDLSGDWVLVSATTSGRLRGEAEAPAAGAERPTSSHTVSGAAFNCGRQCTIVHRGPVLTIEKALLGSNTTPAPPVTLDLDGRQRPVVDSFGPPRELPVTAAWSGNTIEITTATSRSITTTQIVSIEAEQLVVVTRVSIADVPAVTFRYRKE